MCKVDLAQAVRIKEEEGKGRTRALSEPMGVRKLV
jgi:hypothetical protein